MSATVHRFPAERQQNVIAVARQFTQEVLTGCEGDPCLFIGLTGEETSAVWTLFLRYTEGDDGGHAA